MVKVTIIIPVYKVEAYILECLNSVANQTMTKGIECLLVDDCGEDQSIKIAENFVDTYNGDIIFKILYHEKNKGLSAARNTAIMEAEGQYLFFLDSDDYISMDCMESLWSIVEKYPNVDIVQGSMSRGTLESFDEIKASFPEYTRNEKWIRKKLCGLRIMDAACNRLVRRDFIIANSLFFLEGHTQEDSIWTYDIQRFVKSFAFCKKKTYFYRSTPNSIMTSLTLEAKATDYARVHNIALGKMLKSKIYPCEVEHLAVLSSIVTKQIGLKGINLLNNKDNPFATLLYKIQYYRATKRNILIRVFLEVILRIYYIVLSNKSLFLYKINVNHED